MPPARSLSRWLAAVALAGGLSVFATTTLTVGRATATGTTTTTTLPTTTTTMPATTPLTWPQQGSGAIAIPQLSVVVASKAQPRVPIASLTKMMTVWVALQRLPVPLGQSGRCLTVTAANVALYERDLDNEQSVTLIVPGERLCERTLLEGIFVHSAGDYAQLLASLTGLTPSAFVAQMNETALLLGMTHTHYVDETGISPGDRSTASDQLILVTDLMEHEAVVRSVAAMATVVLPEVGLVGSYTPEIGEYGVVGVKSGYTSQAGGCDAMAMRALVKGKELTTYAVILGQHSANALGLAGLAALNLNRSVRAFVALAPTSTGTTLVWTGSPYNVVTTPPTTTTTSSTTTTTSTTSTTTTTLP